LQQLLTESQDRFAESNARLVQITAVRAALNEEIAELRAGAAAGDQASQVLLQQRESELRSSRDELQALQARIAASEDEFGRYQQQMTDTAARQRQAIGDLRVAVAASRAEREQLEEQLASASQQLRSARTDLELEQRRYTNLQDTLREARAQSTASSEALAEKQRQLDGQNQQVASLQQEIDRLNEQSNRYAAEITALKDRAQAQKVEFVGPKIILSEPSEGLLASSARQTRGGSGTRGIAVVAAASVRETRSIRGYVNAPAGLASLTVNGVMVSFDSKNAFAMTIELEEELKKIRIVARDSIGKEAVKEFEYRLDGTAAKAAEVYNKEDRLRKSILGDLQYYALLIANEDYEDDEFYSDLKTPVADVKAIGKILDEYYGFEVEYLINADYDEMGDALERLLYLEQIDEDQDNDKDAILIYYAGHGLADRITSDNVQYFWMPVDARKKSPRSWYETVEISKYLKASSIPQIIVIADSCYAGQMPSRDGMHGISVPTHSPDFAAHVLKRVKMKSRFIFTSGGIEPVVDDGGDGHSVFASVFIDVLRENTGLLSVYDLEEQVSPRVERASRVVGQEQSPYFGYLGAAGHEFGKFYLPVPMIDDREIRISNFSGPMSDPPYAVAQTNTR
jgi:predicted  nucleic acid-binding Zn-ribbon protein